MAIPADGSNLQHSVSVVIKSFLIGVPAIIDREREVAMHVRDIYFKVAFVCSEAEAAQSPLINVNKIREDEGS